MMKNSKLKFSEYMQNINGSKSFGKSVLIVYFRAKPDDREKVKLTLFGVELIIGCKNRIKFVKGMTIFLSQPVQSFFNFTRFTLYVLRTYICTELNLALAIFEKHGIANLIFGYICGIQICVGRPYFHQWKTHIVELVLYLYALR